MSFTLNVNGVAHEIDAAPDTPLLWVIRDHIQLTGTKFGCGLAQCGSCTVYLNGQPIRACVTPAVAVQGQQITTIEGLESKAALAVQKAWDALEVPQCGYCQSGQIMAATALLEQNPSPSDDDIDLAMNGNICRCATYVRIRKAIHAAAKDLA
ncbi:(2Fe-2S)-binding protein [Parasalinivibrio latis]|uniref:(2Fe-2S)-binding protein n=1 Tax=Parasalinivibrio latis TaxID=2952610 RepID=UPI0030E511AE